jgi:hypothetical protein
MANETYELATGGTLVGVGKLNSICKQDPEMRIPEQFGDAPAKSTPG